MRGVTAFLAFAVLAVPLWADHAPSKRKADGVNASRVAERLVGLGMDRAAAERQVTVLTDRELAYFAADLSRVQVVGAAQDMFSGGADLTWYQAVIGIAMLIGAGTWIFMAQQN